MASPMPSMANALMQPTQGPGRFGPAPAPAPAGNLRLPPPNALAVPQAAPPVMSPPAVPAIHPAFVPQPVPEAERISARAPVPKADFPEKHHKDIHDKVLGEHFDDSGAANAIHYTYALLRKTRPHLHPRHVLEAARDAWFAHQHGFMTPQMAGAAVGHNAEMRHQAAGGRHPVDDEEVSGKRFEDIPVRPASEDVGRALEAAFEFGRDQGPRMMPLRRILGGVSEGDDAVRVSRLASQMSGPNGYWSRPIVDTSGNVLEGAHRIEAARSLGAKRIPVHLVQDLARGFDVDALHKAIKGAQSMHGDQRHQLIGHLLEAHADAGSPAAIREEYDPPRGYEAAWNGMLDELTRQRATEEKK